VAVGDRHGRSETARGPENDEETRGASV
jgi:hypothetical protein